jgi:hypothetical protein
MAKLENHFKVVDPFHISTAIHKGQQDQLFEPSVTALKSKKEITS